MTNTLFRYNPMNFLKTRKLLSVGILCQLGLILIFGSFNAITFHKWSPIDESPHFSYIQIFAEQKRLPIMGVDTDKYDLRYPVLNSAPVSDVVGRSSYEAWQPPLYYILVSPAFILASHLSDRISHQIIVLRIASLIIYLLAALSYIALIRILYSEDSWHLPTFFGLNVFLLHPMIVRNTTVSNCVLELLIFLLFSICFALHQRYGSKKYLLGMSIFVGLGLLTKLTLAYSVVLLFLYLLFCLRKKFITIAAAFGYLVIPFVIISPWIVFNYKHFGLLTSGTLPTKLLFSITNPTNYHYTYLHDFFPLFYNYLSTAFTADEVRVSVSQVSSLDLITTTFKIILFIFPFIVFLAQKKKLLEFSPFYLPLILSAAELNILTINQNSPVNFGRYIFPSLTVWFIFLYKAYGEIVKDNVIKYIATLIFTANVYYLVVIYAFYNYR